jgi:hypothetical protein
MRALLFLKLRTDQKRTDTLFKNQAPTLIGCIFLKSRGAAKNNVTLQDLKD